MTQFTIQMNKSAEQLSPLLNKQIANCAVLFMKLHHYHWYVKGTDFYTLHAKFEELYNEVAAEMDVLAERLLAIGGKPIADLQTCLQQASVTEAAAGDHAAAMVQHIVQDFQTMINELREARKLADSLGDDGTSDIMLSMSNSLEKHIWMLQAHLNK